MKKFFIPFLNANGRLPPSFKIIILGDFNIRLGDRVNDTLQHTFPDCVETVDYFDNIGLILESEHLDPDSVQWTHFDRRVHSPSVIDLVWTSPSVHSLRSSFLVDNSFIDSDHRPLLFSFTIPFMSDQQSSTPLYSRPRWKSQLTFFRPSSF